MRTRFCYFTHLQVVLVLLLGILTGCQSTSTQQSREPKASAEAMSVSTAANPGSDSTKLADIIARHWQYTLAEDPILAASG